MRMSARILPSMHERVWWLRGGDGGFKGCEEVIVVELPSVFSF